MFGIIGSSGVFDAATHHEYAGYGLDPTLPAKVWNASFHQIIPKLDEKLEQAVHAAIPGLDIFVGETALCWHSGQNNTSNSYLSGVWLIGQYGNLAKTNSVQCRQALKGGYYELIDKFSMYPNPDFFTSLLWKQTMGQGVLNTIVPVANSDILMFAHCAQSGSGISIAFVNLNATTTYELSLSTLVGGAAISLVPRGEFILTAESDASRTISLNDVEMAYSGPNSLPSSYTPVTVVNPAQPLTLRPHTYGFVQFYTESNPCS
jgi:heparanase 1